MDSRYFSLELCYSKDAIEPTPYNESNLQNQVSPDGPSMWEWPLPFRFKRCCALTQFLKELLLIIIIKKNLKKAGGVTRRGRTAPPSITFYRYPLATFHHLLLHRLSVLLFPGEKEWRTQVWDVVSWYETSVQTCALAGGTVLWHSNKTHIHISCVGRGSVLLLERGRSFSLSQSDCQVSYVLWKKPNK